MQRILPRGEIESLDHTSIPRLRLPQRESVFLERAARFRQLADGNPISAYLKLMAQLCDAQHRVLSGFKAPGASGERISLAQAHGMPPMQAVGWQRDAVWLTGLRDLVDHMADLPDMPQPVSQACSALRQQIVSDPQALEDLADRLLAEQTEDNDQTLAPFVMAALQVYFTDLANRFEAPQMPVVTPFGVCPLCGSLPVSSIVRVGGAADGCRYMCCGLCASEWHLVRVTCSHCESTQGIAYHIVEGGPEAIKAESCDQCHAYRKIFYQEKDLYVDPVADDLGSLMLDMLMGEEGYSRASGNPLLWQEG